MKTIIILLGILATSTIFAAEIEVMKISNKTAGAGKVSASFDVSYKKDKAEVSLLVSKRVRRGKTNHYQHRSFTKTMPELVLNHRSLELTIDGQLVECGKIKTTKLVKINYLKQSGKCTLVAKRSSRFVTVTLITE